MREDAGSGAGGPETPPGGSRLRGRGIRVTPQRQLVLDAVCDLGRATPEQILARVRESAEMVNISTIYRTLELFERIGLVTHNHLGHGAPVYSEHGHPHLHLACQVCGDVIETSASTVDGLAEELASTRGFTLDPTHVALPGRCSGCDTPDTRI